MIRYKLRKQKTIKYDDIMTTLAKSPKMYKI